jgi:hypothetical protein
MAGFIKTRHGLIGSYRRQMMGWMTANKIAVSSAIGYRGDEVTLRIGRRIRFQ